MVYEIKVLSDRKGSNPGGVCNLPTRGSPTRAYFKYCHTNRTRNSALSVENQPIYEAITLQLARQLGLQTVDFYALLNQGKDVHFTGWKDVGINSDPDGRKSYFISRYIPKSVIGSESPNTDERQRSSVILDSRDDMVRMAKILNKDKAYLESILVADVLNKRQNYVYYPSDLNEGQIVYLDLGCSFVRAVNGIIEVPKALEQLTAKESRRLRGRLDGISIISANDLDVVDLGAIADGLRSMKINTLNPVGKSSLDRLLPEKEIEEIYGYILQGLTSSVSEFRKRDLMLD